MSNRRTLETQKELDVMTRKSKQTCWTVQVGDVRPTQGRNHYLFLVSTEWNEDVPTAGLKRSVLYQ